MKIILDDRTLDQMAREYHNEYTKAGTPIYNVMTFESFVEMKSRSSAKRTA